MQIKIDKQIKLNNSQVAKQTAILHINIIVKKRKLDCLAQNIANNLFVPHLYEL